MTLADLDAVKRLEKECGLAPWSAAGYQAELRHTDSICLVATLRADVVGFIVARFQSDAQRRVVEILNLCTEEARRRSGIASALLANVATPSAEGQPCDVLLEVRESNLGAIAFYQAEGFSKIGKRPAFYSDPSEDAITFQRVGKETL